jgi:hypothetical protein
MRLLRWIASFFRDPISQDGSMARLCAFGLMLVAAWAVYKVQPAATIAALVGGGVVAILSRTKAE